ncbi:MAG TPA: type IV pilus assembly protein PilM [Patescibacteria group bacterium]|nr:type IV pilus assembly protein PilM [Patescibacteria group bacterium]
MFGLSFGKDVFVGVDVGTTSVKIIELKNYSGKPVLTNYAWASFDGYFQRDDNNSQLYEIILPDYIKKMMKEAKIKNGSAYVSIPAFGGLITLIEFPPMAKEDMEQAIRFEAHKYVPTSLDEVVLSWDIIGHSGPEQNNLPDGKTQVLLVAASKNKVMRYEKMINNASLRLNSLEIESFSMVRSLIGNDQGNFIVADIGSRVCNILLVERGAIRANRNIDAGGEDITKTIAKSMSISDEKAEKIKIGDKNFFAAESYIKFPSLELISNEINRISQSYTSNGRRIKIDNIILSGGSANLTGLCQHFSQVLNINTIIGNPFSRISYEKKLEPAISKLGARFSIAAGLALKGMEKNNK